jgi:BioD-like phosphotransacetylase family protein
MNLLYVTSDRPGAGKTVTAMAIALAAQKRGLKTGYFKPFCTDPHNDSDVDFGMVMAKGSHIDRMLKPVDLRVSALGHATPAVVVERTQTAAEMAQGCDVLVVEGASLSVADSDLADISHHVTLGLDTKVLAVMDYEARPYTDEMSRITGTFGERLLGVFVNRAIRYRSHEVDQMLQTPEAVATNVLGVVPEDRLMLSVSLNEVAKALEGTWIWGEEQGDSLVERYLIGANLMDSGDTYFNRVDNKAVIVRGDRPDIQLSALTGPVVGLINTGGHAPVEYLIHEVEQLDVPLMVTPHRTSDAVRVLGDTLEEANPYHPRKVSRFLQLLEQHCKIDAVLEQAL